VDSIILLSFRVSISGITKSKQQYCTTKEESKYQYYFWLVGSKIFDKLLRGACSYLTLKTNQNIGQNSGVV
jgi:hypothetical protein